MMYLYFVSALYYIIFKYNIISTKTTMTTFVCPHTIKPNDDYKRDVHL